MNTEEKFILGALVGSAIGAAAALIFTPMTGKSLRTKLMNGLSQAQATPKRRSPSTAHHTAHEGHTAPHAKAKAHTSDHPVKKARPKKRVSH
jgi:gas vesicle protein